MPLMKSIDGRLYNVPDEEASKYLIPVDKVADALKEAGVGAAPAAAGEQQAGQVKADHWSHHHHHGGWGGGPFVVAAPYNNYYNYQNYANYYRW